MLINGPRAEEGILYIASPSFPFVITVTCVHVCPFRNVQGLVRKSQMSNIFCIQRKHQIFPVTDVNAFLEIALGYSVKSGTVHPKCPIFPELYLPDWLTTNRFHQCRIT